MSWFCKHKWSVLDKTEKASIAEMLIRAGTGFEGNPCQTATVVTICTCEHCGDIQKFVTRT